MWLILAVVTPVPQVIKRWTSGVAQRPPHTRMHAGDAGKGYARHRARELLHGRAGHMRNARFCIRAAFSVLSPVDVDSAALGSTCWLHLAVTAPCTTFLASPTRTQVMCLECCGVLCMLFAYAGTDTTETSRFAATLS
jgi:hypothetical protein